MSTNAQTQWQADTQCPYCRLEMAGGPLFPSLLEVSRRKLCQGGVPFAKVDRDTK